MKKLPFLIFITIVFTINLNGQNCEVPQVLIEEYEKDVKHLALIQMEQHNAPELELVEISELWQDTIWKGLAAIFNSTSDARDEVIDQYCIHQNSWTSSNYNRISNSMYVRLEPSASWYQNWENGIITTDDPYLDSLFMAFGVDTVIFTFASLNVFTLHTNEFLNLNALAEKIEIHDDVVYAEKNTGAGDYTRIDYSYVDGEKFFDFSLGWGDCPAGCINRKTWFFSVDEFCNVDFLGTQGNELGIPDPINCNITTTGVDLINTEKYFQITGFPNPTSNEFVVDHKEDQFNELISYEVYNSFGEMVLNDDLIKLKPINLQTLPSGFYLIKIIDSQMKKYLVKVIKI